MSHDLAKVLHQRGRWGWHHIGHRSDAQCTVIGKYKYIQITMKIRRVQSPCITLLADGAAGEAGEVLTQGYVKNDKSKAVLGGAHMSHILSGIAIYLASQDSGGGKPAQREY
jgi:hypothetical protein